MYTVIEPINESNLERIRMIDPPYVVFGHSVLLPYFQVTMTVQGLKEILSFASDKDSLQITIHDQKSIEYSIIREKI